MSVYYAKPTVHDAWLLPTCPTVWRTKVNRAADPTSALTRVPPEYLTAAGRARRGSRWYVRWIDPSGRERRRRFRDRVDADRFADGLMHGDISGRDYTGVPRTVAEACERWLDTKIAVRPATLARYRREVRCYIVPQWGGEPLDLVSPAGVQAWVVRLHEGGYPHADGCAGGPLRRKTIRSIVCVVLRGVMAYAVRQGWVSSDPTSGVELPRSDTKAVRPLSPEQLVALLGEMSRRDPAAGDLTQLLAFTGVRIGEACAMQVGDVDTTRRTIRIQRTWSDGATRLEPPKSGRTRTIAYPPALDDMMARRTVGRDAGGWLIPAARGGPTLPSNFRQRVWRPVVRALGVGWATPHTLRHTYATMAIQAGAVVKDVQTQLGHSSATITLDTYAAWWHTDLSTVAQAVERVALSGPGTTQCITAG